MNSTDISTSQYDDAVSILFLCIFGICLKASRQAVILPSMSIYNISPSYSDNTTKIFTTLISRRSVTENAICIETETHPDIEILYYPKGLSLGHMKSEIWTVEIIWWHCTGKPITRRKQSTIANVKRIALKQYIKNKLGSKSNRKKSETAIYTQGDSEDQEI
eukprot:IDg3189t1